MLCLPSLSVSWILKELFAKPILSILIIFIFPLVIMILIPTAVLRKFVSFLAKLIRPKGLGKMLTTFATMHASAPHSLAIYMVSLIIEGVPDVEKIREGFITNVFEAKDEKNGGFLYPELRQRISSFCGFLFWKDLEDGDNFNPKDCIRLIRSEPIDLDSQEGKTLLQAICKSPINSGSGPLLEILILPLVKGSIASAPHYIMFFRAHHALMDGLSVLNILNKLTEPKITVLSNASKSAIKNQPSKMIVETSLKLLKAPYDLAGFIIQILETGWKFTRDEDEEKSKIKIEGLMTTAMNRDPISLIEIKEIAISNGVTVTTVLLFMVAEALRTSGENDALLYVTIPLPHSDKLRNLGMIGHVLLHLKEKEVERQLESIKKSVDSLKRTSLPLVSWVLGMLFGSQFPPLLKLFSWIDIKLKFNASQPLLYFNNFTFGAQPYLSLLGQRVVGVGPGIACQGSNVLFIQFYTLGEAGFFGVSGDQEIFPRGPKHFMDQMENALFNLKHLKEKNQILHV